MCWETHCRNFRRSPEGIFEEGIHDDPDDSRKTYGACSILYPGMLEQLAERIGGDYYMIPSSVHEFLLVPREREQDRRTEENDRRSEPDGAAAGGSSVGPFISVLQPGEGSKDSVEYRSEYYV